MEFDWKKYRKFLIIAGAILLLLILALVVYFVVLRSSYNDVGEGEGKAREAAISVGEGEDYQKEAAILHNEKRRKHHVDPLKLEAEANKIAVECAEYYANKRFADHSCPGTMRGKRRGESIYISPVTSKMEAVKRAVEGWYGEVKDYDYATGRSIGDSNKAIGHFTQLVWKDSKKLGIGYAARDGTEFLVAIYDPYGNTGDRTENVFKE